MWDALKTGAASPRTELLHEIDRIAFPRFSCSGPIAKCDGNGSAGWSMIPIQDRYVRAAIHMVLNGTSYKLVIGECAGWDTDSQIHSPPHYVAPSPAPLPAHCGRMPARSTFDQPIVDRTWLFNLDEDQSESCDLSMAEPAILNHLVSRLDSYRSTEVPVRYPEGSKRLDPGRCDPPLDYWFASDEPGLTERCTGSYSPPPPPKPHAGPKFRLEMANNATKCLVASDSRVDAWLKVGSCVGNRSQWQQVVDRGSTQLASVAYADLCLNVFGGPPACCPGGQDSNSTKFHLTKCGWGPGNQFNYTGGQVALVGVERWSACADLCIAPTFPLVSLQ